MQIKPISVHSQRSRRRTCCFMLNPSTSSAEVYFYCLSVAFTVHAVITMSQPHNLSDSGLTIYSTHLVCSLAQGSTTRQHVNMMERKHGPTMNYHNSSLTGGKQHGQRKWACHMHAPHIIHGKALVSSAMASSVEPLNKDTLKYCSSLATCLFFIGEDN